MAPLGIDWKQTLGPLYGSGSGVPTDELSQLEHAAFEHAPRAIRWHPRAVKFANSEDFMPWATTTVPWLNRGEVIVDASDLNLQGKVNLNPGAYLSHAAGQYYVQDAGSMLAIALCRVQPGQTIIDTCASPGGKSTGLLESLGGSGCLIANEVISGRVSILQWALERSGFGNHVVTHLEVDRLAAALGSIADCVLVDAPCSGQSMVAKGKQTTAAYSMQTIEHCAARQGRILEAAARLVMPNGRLVYSTCTFAYQENEQVLLDFLSREPDWKLVRDPNFAEWESPHLAGTYRLWPHRHPTAGTFVGVLQRNAAEECGEGLPATTSRKTPSGIWNTIGEDNWGGVDGLASTMLTGLPRERCRLKAIRRDDSLRSPRSNRDRGRRVSTRDGSQHPSFKKAKRENRGNRPKSIAAKRAGETDSELHLFPECDVDLPEIAIAASRIGTMTGDRFEPAFGLSKILASKAAIPRIELQDAQATQYVQGQSLRIDAATSQSLSDAPTPQEGWVLVVWREQVLSWGKLVGRTLKNHFPKIFRQHVALGPQSESAVQ